MHIYTRVLSTSYHCRLSEAVATKSSAVLTAAVGQETLLHQTYGIALPPAHNRNSSVVPGTRDITGTVILNAFHPCLAQHAVPLAVQGDGNCLYRAVSRQLYGNEDMHAILRLLTAIEIACFPTYYDPAAAQYENLVGDDRIHVPDYIETLETVCKFGHESELIHMYPLSAVISMPITSVYPATNVHVEAWNRQVVGRNVNPSTADIKILWSACSRPADLTRFTPTHFVPLHPVANAAQFQPLPSLAPEYALPREQRCAGNKRRRRPVSNRSHTKKRRGATASGPTRLAVEHEIPPASAPTESRDVSGDICDDNGPTDGQDDGGSRDASGDGCDDNGTDGQDAGGSDDNAAPVIVKSQKGAVKLLFSGYAYTKHPRKHDAYIRWRCVRRLLKCNGSLLTDINMANPCADGVHNHDRDDSGCEVVALRDKMRQRVQTSRDKPSVIVAQTLQQASDR